MICQFNLRKPKGYVCSKPSIRSGKRRLLGPTRHASSRLHLLLHRQNPNRLPVRRRQRRNNRSIQRQNSALHQVHVQTSSSSAYILRGHRQRRMGQLLWRSYRQSGAKHRATYDLHTLFSTMRRFVRR